MHIADVFVLQGRILDAFVSKFGTLKHSIPQVEAFPYVLCNITNKIRVLRMIFACLGLPVHRTLFNSYVSLGVGLLWDLRGIGNLVKISPNSESGAVFGWKIVMASVVIRRGWRRR